MQIKIILPITILQKKTLLLIKNHPFQSTLHRDLSRKETGYTMSWVCVIPSSSKGLPNMHSWIITAHISLGDLNRQLHMFNCQKTLAHQLLVKLQGQLLASHFVLNALLDEFSNIDSIYESYKPTIHDQQCSCSKLSQKTCHHLKTHDLREAYYPS